MNLSSFISGPYNSGKFQVTPDKISRLKTFYYAEFMVCVYTLYNKGFLADPASVTRKDLLGVLYDSDYRTFDAHGVLNLTRLGQFLSGDAINNDGVKEALRAMHLLENIETLDTLWRSLTANGVRIPSKKALGIRMVSSRIFGQKLEGLKEATFHLWADTLSGTVEAVPFTNGVRDAFAAAIRDGVLAPTNRADLPWFDSIDPDTDSIFAGGRDKAFDYEYFSDLRSVQIPGFACYTESDYGKIEISYASVLLESLRSEFERITDSIPNSRPIGITPGYVYILRDEEVQNLFSGPVAHSVEDGGELIPLVFVSGISGEVGVVPEPRKAANGGDLTTSLLEDLETAPLLLQHPEGKVHLRHFSELIASSEGSTKWLSLLSRGTYDLEGVKLPTSAQVLPVDPASLDESLEDCAARISAERARGIYATQVSAQHNLTNLLNLVIA